MGYKRLGDNLFKVAFEVSLRNHKKEDIRVVLVGESIPGDWEMLSNTNLYDKLIACLNAGGQGQGSRGEIQSLL